MTSAFNSLTASKSEPAKSPPTPRRTLRRVLLPSTGIAALWLIFGCAQTINLGTLGSYVAECNVTRTECTGWVLDKPSNTLQCPTANQVINTFNATRCYLNTSTQTAQTACDYYCNNDQGQNPLAGIPGLLTACKSTPFGPKPQFAADGVCSKSSGASNGLTTRASCTRGGRFCTAMASGGPTGSYCTTLSPLSPLEDGACFDPTVESAENECFNSSTSPTQGALEFPFIFLDGEVDNSTSCRTPVTPATPALAAYGIGIGSIGSVSALGTSIGLSAKGGYATVQTTCDQFEHCDSELYDMRIAVADTTVNGVAIKNGEVRLEEPVPIAFPPDEPPTIAAGSMSLNLSADALGGSHRVTLSPNTDVRLNLGTDTFTMTGQFNTTAEPSGNTLVPAGISLNITGSTSNPQAACGQFTPIQSLFGFEDLSLWTSSQATLSLSGTELTQGCFGMNVAGSGFMTLTSGHFVTPVPGVTSHLALDVFVPPNQPNPSYLGAVQMYFSCPSATINNLYLGQVELTGKKTGVFSTLKYNLPSSVVTALQHAHTDAFFAISVNANPTPTPVVVDNLRFVP
jgi:hypothetical protein